MAVITIIDVRETPGKPKGSQDSNCGSKERNWWLLEVHKWVEGQNLIFHCTKSWSQGYQLITCWSDGWIQIKNGWVYRF